MTTTLTTETYLSDDAGKIAPVQDFLASHAAAGHQPGEARFCLSGGGMHDQIELPSQVYDALVQVVSALAQGLAVTVSPHALSLTTQQAAELLGVSRPTLVRLLDRGDLPYEKPGRHRRLLLTDVIAYRTERRRRQYEALDALPFDDVETTSDALESLRHAKRSAGAARRIAAGNMT